MSATETSRQKEVNTGGENKTVEVPSYCEKAKRLNN